jgi:hypothetical protein
MNTHAWHGKAPMMLNNALAQNNEEEFRLQELRLLLISDYRILYFFHLSIKKNNEKL